MNDYKERLLEEANRQKTRKLNSIKGSIAWDSPSNIAIVKYWGKYPGQLPANASLSVTLSKAITRTAVSFRISRMGSGPRVQFVFEGKKSAPFEARIRKYLNEITPFMPWLNDAELEIRSENTFPHSSGIASSASAMSALALCLCDIHSQLFEGETEDELIRKASFLSRLGSGSASRSVYGPMSVWGATSGFNNTSDEYAIPVSEIHENFHGLNDSILIIESGTKQVSSSLGHDLMKTNPYAGLRFDVAEENMQKLERVIIGGDWMEFIDIMENEALTLHAMMMTSYPGYILMKPNTLEAIQMIREFRNSTGMPIGFTLDAGANVHTLYPKEQEKQIRAFIERELSVLCEQGIIIHDRMGDGPTRQNVH